MSSQLTHQKIPSLAPSDTDDERPLILRASVAAMVTMLVAVLAIGLSLGDGGKRLSHSWLLNTWFVLSICLGAVFFVAIQHITRAGWSVTIRRFAEYLGAGIIVPVALLVPLLVSLLLGDSKLFPWNDHQLIQNDALMQSKSSYLNATFFSLRTLVYGAIWIGSALWMLRISVTQDRMDDPQLTLKLERRSAPILLAMGLSVTFAAFDWLMSLDPYWFSSIFGVYLFSGSMVAGLAVIAIFAGLSVKSDEFTGFITREHLHDVAKLLFGFNCFWAYIAFSQYLLIWYANIPEETVWLKHRQEHGWFAVTLLLAVGHFAVPFLLMMPRAAKRSANLVIGMSVWLLVMHWADLYWIIYPQFEASPSFGALEVVGLLFTASATAVGVFALARDKKLVPLSDPRIREAVSHQVH